MPEIIKVGEMMQQVSGQAVAIAKEKFGYNLDFTGNSLQLLEVLLQQAHERYTQYSGGGSISNASIEKTVRVWGSYLGEVIRRKLGGDWVIEETNVFLQVGNQKLDPIGQVRSRIVSGPQYNLQEFYRTLLSGLQNNQVYQSAKHESDNKDIETSNIIKSLTKNHSIIYIAVGFGVLIILGLCIGGGLLLQKQGIIGVSINGNLDPQTPSQTNVPLPTIASTSTYTPAPTETPTLTATTIPTSPPLATMTSTSLPTITFTPSPTPMTKQRIIDVLTAHGFTTDDWTGMVCQRDHCQNYQNINLDLDARVYENGSLQLSESNQNGDKYWFNKADQKAQFFAILTELYPSDIVTWVQQNTQTAQNGLPQKTVIDANKVNLGFYGADPCGSGLSYLTVAIVPISNPDVVLQWTWVCY